MDFLYELYYKLRGYVQDWVVKLEQFGVNDVLEQVKNVTDTINTTSKSEFTF